METLGAFGDRPLARGIQASLCAAMALAAGSAAAQSSGDAPASSSGGASKGGFFSQFGQALTHSLVGGGDSMVVRGYADMGAPTQRVYCIVDGKTGARQANAVNGDLQPLGNGVVGITPRTVSIFNCDKLEQQGKLVTAGYTLPQGTGAASTGAGPAAPGNVDTSSWNILGVKIGDSADNVEAELRQTYPKVVRADHEMHYHYKHFATPTVVLGTEYVAGKAITAVATANKFSRGAQELGDESDMVDIEYVWPSLGSAVAIQRYHLYDSSRRLDPHTLPSLDSLKKTLFERFGPPAGTSTGSEGISFNGGTFPTVTWTWATNPSILLNGKLQPRCADWHIFQFSSRNDNGEIISPDPGCGTYLTVTVETVDHDYVESVQQQLVDSAALATAFKSLGEYLETGENEANSALKAHGDAAKPAL